MTLAYRFQILVELIADLGASLLWGGLINWLSWAALIRAFESSDANSDGQFTISDIWLQFKNVFFATGDSVTLWIADTSFGKFFEMNYQEPSLGLSFWISFTCWFLLFGGLYGATDKFQEWQRIRRLK